ncbi:MAG: hypothetical protein HY903_24260 [Deltaproteobacteria bacterium]|nr:hypothetical protein [Deltaproteobacteria bacterium]
MVGWVVLACLSMPSPAEIPGDDAVAVLAATRSWLTAAAKAGDPLAPVVLALWPEALRQDETGEGGGDLLFGVYRDPAARRLAPFAGPEARGTNGTQGVLAAERQALAKAAPGALFYGVLQVQRLYGLLARTPDGARFSGRIRRLGLEGLGVVTLAGRRDHDGRLVADLRVTVRSPHAGILDALGPPAPAIRPTEVPTAALAWGRVMLRPARLWAVAQKVLAQLDALQVTLATAQLQGIEDELRLSLDRALGDDGRPTLAYLSRTKGERLDLVVAAELADPFAVLTLCERYTQVLTALLPDLRFAATDGPEGRTLSVAHRRRAEEPFLALAVRAATARERPAVLVVATSKAALSAYLKRKVAAAPAASGEAVATAAVNGELLPVWLQATGRSRPDAGALAAALADTRLRLLWHGDELHLEAVTTSRALSPKAARD